MGLPSPSSSFCPLFHTGYLISDGKDVGKADLENPCWLQDSGKSWHKKYLFQALGESNSTDSNSWYSYENNWDGIKIFSLFLSWISLRTNTAVGLLYTVRSLSIYDHPNRVFEICEMFNEWFTTAAPPTIGFHSWVVAYQVLVWHTIHYTTLAARFAFLRLLSDLYSEAFHDGNGTSQSCWEVRHK